MLDQRFEFFNETPVTRELLLLSGRRYLGIPYTKGRSVIWENDGQVTGKLSCLGFCFRVAIDAKLLPEDFPINGIRYDKNHDFDDLVEAVLANNFIEIPIDKSGPGDFLKMSYTDIDPDAPLHVAMKTTWEGMPSGYMIHAMNYHVGGIYSGSVVENRIDINEHKRILSAHQLKGLSN